MIRKLSFLALICLLSFGAIQTSADASKWGEANTSELYYINVPVEKVYLSRKGYVVLFRAGTNTYSRAYIPYEWFRAGEERKATLALLGDGKVQPCMSVFYKEGEFHSVKLYVSRRQSHPSWGVIPSTASVDKHFEGVESINLGINAGQ